MIRSLRLFVQTAALVAMAVMGVEAAYTITGYNNATWGGVGGAADFIAANSSGYVAMTSSNCPTDTLMKYAVVYAGKIFNGCLDECSGDPGGTTAATPGHGIATVCDWNSVGSWAAVTIYSNLHHTGIWPEGSGPYPLTLTFWIKGDVGGEQTKFTVSLAFHSAARNKDTNSVAVRVPFAITTSWQRVVIPWTSFNVTGLSAWTPVGMALNGWQSGKVTVFIDQAYACRHVPVATPVTQAIQKQRVISASGQSSITVESRSAIRRNLSTTNVFDITGRQIGNSAKGLGSYGVYVIKPVSK